MLARFKLNWLTAIGLFFFLLGALSLWYCGRNTIAYLRMRHAETRVIASSLKIFSRPPVNSDPEDQPWPFEFSLHLTLETVGDSSPRRIVEDLDLDRAAYPEEAYDELAFWAPGTRHRVHFLRGDARDVRLGPEDDTPEFGAAIGLAMCAVFCTMFGMATLVAASEEEDRVKWMPRLGPWIIFFSVGLILLCGAAAFAVKGIRQARDWQTVQGKIVDTERRWDAASVPPGTTVDTAVAARLAEATPYRVIEFRLGDRLLHAGRGGARRGSLDEFEELRFRVNPQNRFEVSRDEAWGREFTFPLAALFFMGLGFAGAGLAIRRSGN